MIQPPFFIWQGDGGSAPAGAGRVHAWEAWATAPHIFFCLDKRKRAAPGTKENRRF